jgi:hypothetical protein
LFGQSSYSDSNRPDQNRATAANYHIIKLKEADRSPNKPVFPETRRVYLNQYNKEVPSSLTLTLKKKPKNLISVNFLFFGFPIHTLQKPSFHLLSNECSPRPVQEKA